MSCIVRNLSVLAYAQGFTLWHYNAPTRRMDEVCADDYFDDLRDMLADGDMLMVSAMDGGRMLVASSVGGRVRMMPLG